MPLSAIQHISAITLAVSDMRRAVEFYQKLGFELFCGGVDSTFSTLRSGQAIVNLAASAERRVERWGRVIFRVSDVDAYCQRVKAAGLAPNHLPQDASWGERFFHISDPDNHELSFAQLLKENPAS